MKLVEKNFLQFNNYFQNLQKFNLKIAKINSTVICAFKALKPIFYAKFIEYFTTIAQCQIYATEEMKACREFTTSDILSFIPQDKFLDLSSTKKQVFQKSLVFSFAKSYPEEQQFNKARIFLRSMCFYFHHDSLIQTFHGTDIYLLRKMGFTGLKLL